MKTEKSMNETSSSSYYDADAGSRLVSIFKKQAEMHNMLYEAFIAAGFSRSESFELAKHKIGFDYFADTESADAIDCNDDEKWDFNDPEERPICVVYPDIHCMMCNTCKSSDCGQCSMCKHCELYRFATHDKETKQSS